MPEISHETLEAVYRALEEVDTPRAGGVHFRLRKEAEAAPEETVRVLRVVEYVGPRHRVEETVARSIQGEKRIRDLVIRAATIGSYPEIIGAERTVQADNNSTPKLLCTGTPHLYVDTSERYWFADEADDPRNGPYDTFDEARRALAWHSVSLGFPKEPAPGAFPSHRLSSDALFPITAWALGGITEISDWLMSDGTLWTASTEEVNRQRERLLAADPPEGVLGSGNENPMSRPLYRTSTSTQQPLTAAETRSPTDQRPT